MTKFERISWFAAFVVALLLPGRGAAQNAVTPAPAPLPPGQLITVNNGPGDHFDPHVSGDLVAYSNLDPSGGSAGYSEPEASQGRPAAVVSPRFCCRKCSCWSRL